MTFTPQYNITKSENISMLIIFSTLIGICYSLYKYYLLSKIKIKDENNLFTDTETEDKVESIYDAISESSSSFLASEYKYMSYFYFFSQ
jgi:hypothetical protein